MAETIDEYEIAFDVGSDSNRCAASDVVAATGQGRRALGVLFEIPEDRIYGRNRPDKLKTMEEIEGDRYEPKPIRVRGRDGNEIAEPVVTFLVKDGQRRTGLATSAAYVSWIVYGLREHGASEEYIVPVQEVAVQTNIRARANTDQNPIIKKL